MYGDVDEGDEYTDANGEAPFSFSDENVRVLGSPIISSYLL